MRHIRAPGSPSTKSKTQKTPPPRSSRKRRCRTPRPWRSRGSAAPRRRRLRSAPDSSAHSPNPTSPRPAPAPAATTSPPRPPPRTPPSRTLPAPAGPSPSVPGRQSSQVPPAWLERAPNGRGSLGAANARPCPPSLLPGRHTHLAPGRFGPVRERRLPGLARRPTCVEQAFADTPCVPLHVQRAGGVGHLRGRRRRSGLPPTVPQGEGMIHCTTRVPFQTPSRQGRGGRVQSGSFVDGINER